jgi:hypothetical protein
MKRFIVATTLQLTLVAGFAQGTLNFANAAFGLNAPVFDSDRQTLLAGSIWAAELYWAPGVVTDTSVLMALGVPATFSSGSQAGYFFGDTRTIPGVAGGEVITAQVRVWNLADGASWAQAAIMPFGRIGESTLLLVTVTSLPFPPANLTGLTSFSIDVPISIPEPLGFELLVLLAAVGLARSRKSSKTR